MSEFRFYLLEDEQKKILKEILKETYIEGIVQTSDKPLAYSIISQNDMDNFPLSGKGIGWWVHFYLWNKHISPKVFHSYIEKNLVTKNTTIRESPGFPKSSGDPEEPIKRLSLEKSGIIEFRPSMTVNDKTLLQGRIAIFSKNKYDEAGIDGAAVKEWFTKIKRLITKDCGQYVRLRKISEKEGDITGLYKVPYTACVSPSVREWLKSGKKLKEFSDTSPIYFTVDDK